MTGETFVGRVLHLLPFYEAAPRVFTATCRVTGAVVFATLFLCPPQRRFTSKPRSLSAGGTARG